MMAEDRLNLLRDIIQQDVGQRGLARDPTDNLFTRCRDDLAAACRDIATTPRSTIGVVTGFTIVSANPPSAETDGPLGAVFLARALVPLGIAIEIASDPNCREALRAGLSACGLDGRVPVSILPAAGEPAWSFAAHSHYIAIERPGPSHTRDEVPEEDRDRCHNMRGRDITAVTRPAHLLFDRLSQRGNDPARPRTIGIGDGGNEIGMGKMPWDTIRRNIPNGGRIACRVPTDYLIVAGVSNWGAYALAGGILLLRSEKGDAALFDPDRERELLRIMVEQGPLVDGVAAQPQATVDGLTWEEYAKPLRQIGDILSA